MSSAERDRRVTTLAAELTELSQDEYMASRMPSAQQWLVEVISRRQVVSDQLRALADPTDEETL
ncbi:hypothetical protein [Amycolatopsis sp. NPDC058986]|uniref:hypothetical protein n=1 Tax=unclassified Amycolatopsis TaxID=2618356 RepID=UPI00367056BC